MQAERAAVTWTSVHTNNDWNPRLLIVP